MSCDQGLAAKSLLAQEEFPQARKHKASLAETNSAFEWHHQVMVNFSV